MHDLSMLHILCSFFFYLILKQVDESSLSSHASQSQSAEDKRQSSTNIGYLGIGMVAFAFGLIVLIDLQSLYRDANILAGNLREGLGRLRDCYRREA